MQLFYEQVERHLQQVNLLPVYLLHGDAPLLMQDIRDAIRQKAHHDQFALQPLLLADDRFDWTVFKQLADQPTLFHPKTMIDIRLQTTELNTQATLALTYYLNKKPHNQCLLLSKPKITSTQNKSKWHPIIEQYGAIISLFPLYGATLKNWIRNRLKKRSLSIDPEGIALLAERTEGNLLETHQAIEKLQLLKSTTPITATDIHNLLSDEAQFTVFDLTHRLMTGDTSSALRILAILKTRHMPVMPIIGVIARDLRKIYHLSIHYQKGASLSEVVAHEWKRSQPALKAAILNFSVPSLHRAFQQLHVIDQIAKGYVSGNVWDPIENLILALHRS